MDAPKSEARSLPNDVRRELGLSPRPHLVGGMRDIPDHCPIARAARAEAPRITSFVDGNQIAAWVGPAGMADGPDHTFALTKDAALFCLRFDEVRYPELVTEPGR